VVVLNRKGDASQAIQESLLELEASSGHRVAAVRTDNGGEFLVRDLKAFFAARGVQHELSAPYTPQQNGKAERLNRTLEDRVRAMPTLHSPFVCGEKRC
jgi:transposase InsO family protein